MHACLCVKGQRPLLQTLLMASLSVVCGGAGVAQVCTGCRLSIRPRRQENELERPLLLKHKQTELGRQGLQRRVCFGRRWGRLLRVECFRAGAML